MMHDLDLHVDADGPYHKCKVCGMIFDAKTPLSDMQASICVGGKRIIGRFSVSRDVIDRMLENILQSTQKPEARHIPYPTPYEDCDTKGTRLIEKWIEETGQ